VYVQLTVGRAAHPDELRRQLERWELELAPGAEGWLGSTGGITPDGRFVLVARFESAEAAGASSERPGHQAWWSMTEGALDGPPTRAQTSDVGVVHAEQPAVAGFAQVMRASVRDRARLEATEEALTTAFLELRPDFLAGYRAWFPDGSLAAVDYFRSEAEARAGEAREMPEQLAAGFRDWMALLEETEWYDLPDPWLAMPR
jgi:hypothetical protein